MSDLAQIAIKKHQLDEQVWSASEHELAPGYYGVFHHYVHRAVRGIRSGASLDSKHIDLLDQIAGHVHVKKSPLSLKNRVDAVIHPSGFYKGQAAVRIYSPHVVSSKRVQSKMPAILEENPKFGRDSDDDEDEEDEDEDEDEALAVAIAPAPKRLCIRP
jgi:hypothetical protein